MAVTFSNIALEEPSTVTARVASVTIARGSTNEQQEILVIGDPQSSIGLAQVLGSAPPSTTPGLVVRIAEPSTGPFQVSSLAGKVDIFPSAPAAGTYVPIRLTDGATFLDPSTIVTISTIQGAVIIRSSAANALFTAYQSTQADLRATVYQSTASDLLATVRLQTSSGGGVEGSTTSPSSGVLGVHVRHVAPPPRSVYSTVVSTASTAFYTLVSSVASMKCVVRGYSVTSTAVSAVPIFFYSGTNTVLWHTEVGSGSSGVTGANFGLNDGVFETAAGAPLNVQFGSTGVEIKLSIAYHPEA